MTKMKSYLEGCGLKAGTDVVGLVQAATADTKPTAPAAAAAPASTSMLSFVPKMMTKEAQKEAMTAHLVGLGAGVLTAVLWKKHRVLGFFAGGAAGAGAYEMYKGNRRMGATYLGGAALGTYASLKLRKNLTANSAVDYVIGSAAGSAAAYIAAGQLGLHA